jgi:hypothetical protein
LEALAGTLVSLEKADEREAVYSETLRAPSPEGWKLQPSGTAFAEEEAGFLTRVARGGRRNPANSRWGPLDQNREFQ